MSDGYQILSLDEIEPVPYHAREGEKLLTVDRLLAYRAAGVNAWLGDPGEILVPPHEEDSGMEELYVVVRGRAAFTVADETDDAPAGTLVFVQPGVRRTAVAQEPGTIVLAIGASVGAAHQPAGWTTWVVADALRREGRVDEARRVMHEMLEHNADVWYAPYNAACFEALAGDADAAFELLRRALELDAENVRRHAAEDTDLELLREDPRWQEMVA